MLDDNFSKIFLTEDNLQYVSETVCEGGISKHARLLYWDKSITDKAQICC